MTQFDTPDHSSDTEETHHYDGAVGGWGSLKGLSAVVLREKSHPVALAEELLRQNKQGGFMCVSCAWSKPAKPNPAEFCENGAKATAWDLTRHRRVTRSVLLGAGLLWTGEAIMSVLFFSPAWKATMGGLVRAWGWTG